MCPLRFILVFFSAVLAGYFAWRTVRSSPEDEASTPEPAAEAKSRTDEDRDPGLRKVIENVFWIFVDMASGRYLWRNLKEMRNQPDKVKSS
ncbi:uncharacterized protein LOC104442890 [Eucalyptus grandis]|uniref:Uncharacterized protein n=3 Tax=Eucalyptus TaxID=3932 RepID=A0ACC3M779_EUCGR|nr:uncharacterized protein LOC104442890 [Eucalyptus grandis]KAK3446391.1 hypothetical protein EUGRSUZ_A02098 [Eucalyptus grandis]